MTPPLLVGCSRNVGEVVTVEICFTKTQLFKCIILLGEDEAADPGSAEANLSLSEENKPWLLNRKLPTYVVGVWGAADGGCRCSTLHLSASHQLVNLSSVPSITLVVFHILRKLEKK